MYDGGREYAQDTLRVVTIFLHVASPLRVMTGLSAPVVDLTRHAKQVRQGPAETTVSVSWHQELYGAAQPTVGQILEIKMEGESYWIGIVQAINDYRLASGEKSLTILARSRDATPAFRDVRRVTDVYPTATPLGYIGRQVAQAAGLSDAEILLQDTGTSTVHSNTQLADLTPWQMLTTLYQPAGLEPYVDCRGRLKNISRDINRPADIVLPDKRRLIEVTGSKAIPTTTEVRVKWLDPELSESVQQARLLDRATITAGFFQLKQERMTYFGADQTQRARDTHMVIRQSCNGGLFSFCTENYEQNATTSGKITVRTSGWAPGLAAVSLGAMVLSGALPDYSLPTGGPTIPTGKVVHAIAEGAILLTMMSIGTGQYEIWGTPYTYVHARNTTTAFNSGSSIWEIKPTEIENDFVMNEPQAQGFAIRELIYQHRAASQYNLTIVDDTRVERGDIIQLDDGTRVYVTDYTRDLGSGQPAILHIQGFRADLGNSAFTVVPTSPPLVPNQGLPPDFGLPYIAPARPVLPEPRIPEPPPPGSTGGPDELPAIYIPAVPVHESTDWVLHLVEQPGMPIEVIAIDDWGIGGVSVVGPKNQTEIQAAGFGLVAGDAYSLKLFKDYKQRPNGIGTSSSAHPLSRDQLAFGWAGSWSPLPPAGQLNDSTLVFHAESLMSQNLSTGEMYLTVSADPEYTITAGGFTSDSVGPRNWNVESDNKIIHMVRDQPFFGPGPFNARLFRVKHTGLNFYRLNVSQTYASAHGVTGASANLRIQNFEMYVVPGGTNVAIASLSGLSGGGATGFGDSSGSYITPQNAGRWAFVAGTGYYLGAQSYGWLRFEFSGETQIVEYGIQAQSSNTFGSPPFSWTFEVSVDGVNWWVVDTRTAIVFTPGQRLKFMLPRRVIFGDPP
jgi:hypothetical protein